LTTHDTSHNLHQSRIVNEFDKKFIAVEWASLDRVETVYGMGLSDGKTNEIMTAKMTKSRFWNRHLKLCFSLHSLICYSWFGLTNTFWELETYLRNWSEQPSGWHGTSRGNRPC